MSAAIHAACRGGIHKKPQLENRPLVLPRPRGYENFIMYLEEVGWCGLSALIDVRLQWRPLVHSAVNIRVSYKRIIC